MTRYKNPNDGGNDKTPRGTNIWTETTATTGCISVLIGNNMTGSPDKMQRTDKVSLMISAGMLLLHQAAWAGTGTTLDAAVTTLNNMFILAAFLLGAAGTAGLVYSIAQRTYGLIFDGAIALLLGCAVVGSWPFLGNLVGVSAAATLPIPPIGFP